MRQGKSFASFGDKLADRKVACRVKGCPRTWLWRSAEQVKAFAAGQMEPPQRMCDLCHARAQTLEDMAVPCMSSSCTNTFPWSRFAQLEAIMSRSEGALEQPPRGLCEACRGKARDLGDTKVPCRVRGCNNTWTWSGRAQLAAGATADAPKDPPARMCDDCHAKFESSSDERRPCKIRGCTNSWMWTRWQRLEAGLAGKDAPPERMCDDCLHLLKTLEDEQRPCRTQGCDGSWTYTRGQKLEAHHIHHDDVPARMCASCQSHFSHLQDLQVPCKRNGCKNSWLYRRGAQLERWVRQKKSGEEHPHEAPPQRLCDGCRKGLDAFADKEVPCKNTGCKRTWTWTRFAQLQAAEAKHHDPPHHMCDECRKFLEHAKTKTIVCTGCAAQIHWAPELQIKTMLGLMKEPTLCGSCKQAQARQATASSRPSTVR